MKGKYNEIQERIEEWKRKINVIERGERKAERGMLPVDMGINYEVHRRVDW